MHEQQPHVEAHTTEKSLLDAVVEATVSPLAPGRMIPLQQPHPLKTRRKFHIFIDLPHDQVHVREASARPGRTRTKAERIRLTHPTGKVFYSYARRRNGEYIPEGRRYHV